MTSGAARTLALLLLVSFPALPAAAQCPDGTPPPCRGGGPAAPVRRPNPPLDDRTWIIVPFDNVARAADIDWLKDASVNLLYLDMSKWRDIRVIDDERVADLIREVPEARAGGQVSLQGGIAVARRAGAGNLVMGDLLKVGSRTQVIGKVFNVRTGQRVRTVRQDAASSDSLMAAFGQLARGVLNVAPPEGVSLGAVGTASVDAYQSYIAGVAFLNRWILDSARTRFTQALQLDSTFALAHYKLALVYGWESSGSSEGVRHADQAVRLGTSLPARERSLVKGYAEFENHRYADACQIFQNLIRADSSDVEAWYQLGECNYHDTVVLPVPGDTANRMFRSSWTTAVKAFRKTLELDPTYHLAFQHIQDTFLANVRTGCLPVPNSDPCADQSSVYQAFLRRSGDTLLLEPVSVFRTSELSQQAEAARREGARRLNLADAQRAAEAWLAAGPSEARPRVAYGRILLRQGAVETADSVFRLVPASARMTKPEAANLFIDRIEIAVKRGNVAEARRLIDSLSALAQNAPGGRLAVVLLNGILGKTAALGPAIEQQLQAPSPDWVKRYYVQQTRALFGAPADSVFAAEAEFARNAARGPGVGAGRAAGLIAVSLLFVDLRLRGDRWPVIDTANQDLRIATISYLARGDTAAFKQRLARLDTLAAQGRDAPDAGVALAAAQFLLAVRDSARALAALRAFRDTTWARTPILDPLGPGFARSGVLWPRTLLLLGDLAAAMGRREVSADAYRRFIGLWENGDQEVQPMVERARAALARLGGQ